MKKLVCPHCRGFDRLPNTFRLRMAPLPVHAIATAGQPLELVESLRSPSVCPASEQLGYIHVIGEEFQVLDQIEFYQTKDVNWKDWIGHFGQIQEIVGPLCDEYCFIFYCEQCNQEHFAKAHEIRKLPIARS